EGHGGGRVGEGAALLDGGGGGRGAPGGGGARPHRGGRGLPHGPDRARPVVPGPPPGRAR
ncbi:MAG: hypothetical protein AVDCRST_MAG12-1582, partial [uncultured Rubrobacteraceae bacterium]